MKYKYIHFLNVWKIVPAQLQKRQVTHTTCTRDKCKSGMSVGSVLVSPERCMSQLFVHSESSCSITYKPTCIETYKITIKQINGSSNLNLTITFPDTKLSLCSKITKLSIKSLSQVTSKADTLFRHDTLSAFEAHTRHVPRSMQLISDNSFIS